MHANSSYTPRIGGTAGYAPYTNPSARGAVGRVGCRAPPPVVLRRLLDLVLLLVLPSTMLHPVPLDPVAAGPIPARPAASPLAPAQSLSLCHSRNRTSTSTCEAHRRGTLPAAWCTPLHASGLRSATSLLLPQWRNLCGWGRRPALRVRPPAAIVRRTPQPNCVERCTTLRLLLHVRPSHQRLRSSARLRSPAPITLLLLLPLLAI